MEAEFTRITTVPLRSKFMQQLDHHSTQLMTIKSKGGAAGRKIRNIMADLDKVLVHFILFQFYLFFMMKTNQLVTVGLKTVRRYISASVLQTVRN